MSIFIDQGLVSGAQSSTAFGNLYTISGQDGNLGDTPVAGDITVLQVTYAGAAPALATANRLHTLVNTNFGTPIVITALAGGIDPFSGLDITGNGATYVDSSSGADVIRVVYDVNQCNFAGIFTFDTGGNPITTPNPVILYHELSHAFRGATGTTQPNDEIPARTDENVMRGQLGLCLRDVNSNGLGCGPGSDCGAPPPNGCFIVSATTGSSESAEVKSLRQLRDRIADVSCLGARLIDMIYREYYQFSPSIADEIGQSAASRQAVLWVVVRPLLAWYTLAGTLAFEHADQNAANNAVKDVLNACPRYLGAKSIASVLNTIRSGEPLPTDAPEMLLHFAPRIQFAARLRFASWAILDPLVRVWSASAQQRDVIDEVSQWLATAPLEALAQPSDLDKELKALANFFDFRPTARHQLGERLATAWPDAITMLARHDFI